MENFLARLEDLRRRFSKTKALLDIDSRIAREKELRLMMSEPDFWNDQETAVKVAREAEEAAAAARPWLALDKELTEAGDLASLAASEDKVDPDLEAGLEAKLEDLEKDFGQLEFLSLFSGQYDHNDALVSLHAGTGGVDAQDWTEMLERMYLRFAERSGFKAEVLDRNYGNEAGLKSAVLKISGPWAYAYLKSENGTHRLLRNSPFNADGLRQTSFALVEVLPEIKDDKSLIIKDEDLRIDVFRSSGPGGQSVNTTDSAVRIVHIPTGIVVSCQTERSQHQNKENAMEILRAKLNKLALEERETEERRLKGGVQKAEWGAQIRSYCLYGNRYVKDHRTGLETANVDAVLDGDIKAFMEAYLHWAKTGA